MNYQIKHFAIKLVAFCFLFLIIFTLTLLSFSIIIYQNKSIYAIDKSCNILILGDSHTECALNDTLLSHSVNISASADAYIYSYLKLRKLVKNNPQIDIILLGYGYHDLSPNLEEWVYGEKYILNKIPTYACFMKYSEIQKVIKYDPELAPSLILYIYRSAFKLFVKSILGQNYIQAGFGGYRSLSYNKLKEDIQRLSKKIDQAETGHNISLSQAKYLLLISNFCKRNKIRLILIATPIYKNLLKSSKNMKVLYYEFYEKYLFNNVLLDYSDENMPDSCYADSEHLNRLGSKVFSIIVYNKLHYYQKE